MSVLEKRQSGILLHPTALPGKHGIGDLGPNAYKFIDDLHDMKQSLWQVLPLSPTDYSNSPYSSISTFAGNHLLISFDLLIRDGLLDSKSLDHSVTFSLKKIDFKNVIDFKIKILKEVSKNFKINASSLIQKKFQDFCIKNSYWLDEYSKYCALLEENNRSSWIDWESKYLDEKIIYESKVIQFLFHQQWSELRSYCKRKGIKIVGDMPIYVGYDSSDVFFNRSLFQLDEKGKMIFQSGCPPCEYQENGQLWGTPLYNWEYHEETNFNWWQKRFQKIFEMVDVVRLDHFIGYSKYYRIPNDGSSAKNGEWLKAPGKKLFNALKDNIDDFNVFSEDLGDVTEDVIKLRDKFYFPGMHVLQFDFEDLKLEQHRPRNAVLCTGTHDNDTLMGWFNSLSSNDNNKKILTKDKLLKYFKCEIDEIHWEIINYAFASSSNIVIIPIQDIYGEGSIARFNTPGTLSSNNWSWRFRDKEVSQSLKNKLAELTEVHNRINFKSSDFLNEEMI